MASFKAKISWERLRKRENKKNRSDEFISDPDQRIPKKQKKKFKKLKNTNMASFQAKISQEKLGKSKNEKNKKIIPMSSYLTRNREFQKNSKKIQKIKKHHYSFFSSQNKLGMAENERK